MTLLLWHVLSWLALVFGIVVVAVGILAVLTSVVAAVWYVLALTDPDNNRWEADETGRRVK